MIFETEFVDIIMSVFEKGGGGSDNPPRLKLFSLKRDVNIVCVCVVRALGCV